MKDLGEARQILGTACKSREIGRLESYGYLKKIICREGVDNVQHGQNQIVKYSVGKLLQAFKKNCVHHQLKKRSTWNDFLMLRPLVA